MSKVQEQMPYTDVAERSSSSLDSSPSQTARSPRQSDPIILEKKGKVLSSIKLLAVMVILMTASFYGWQVHAAGNADTNSYIKILIANSDKNFNFQVYCPISYYHFLPQSQKDKMSDDLRRLAENQKGIYTYGPYQFNTSSIDQFNDSAIYVVEMTSLLVQNFSNSSQSIPAFLYCGLTRDWAGDCTNPEYSCSSPGPVFDFQLGETVDVIWINQLNSQIYAYDQNSCIANSTFVKCPIQKKENSQKTYFRPTNMGCNQLFDSFNMNPEHWPAVTHIHGLEIRPTFDGNPLSWVGNSGEKGVGAMSLDYSCYYDNFDNSDTKPDISHPPNYKFVNQTLNNVSKINRYPNLQNPGNLWYHDHSMSTTRYNVQNGLSGVYIIRNSTLEKALNFPSRQNERFIMLNINGWVNSENIIHEQNTVYRYRLLNNGARPNYILFFSNQSCSKAQLNSNQTREIALKKIPFMIIGADSSLVNETIPNIDQVIMGSAERIEIMIEFQQNLNNVSVCTIILDSMNVLPVPKQQQKNKNAVKEVLRFDIKPKRNDESSVDIKTSKLDLSSLQYLNVPFTNLSLIPDSGISRFRMRPLIVSTDFHFMINGHWNFHQGHSEDPQIGTVQDWYLINCINEAHPIHVHLINFQVIEQKRLRYLYINLGPNNGFSSFCSLYELDYYMATLRGSSNATIRAVVDLVVSKGIVNYTTLCNMIKNTSYTFVLEGQVTNWTQLFYNGLEESSYNVNIENQFDQKTRISGIDVNEQINNDPSYSAQLLAQSNCPNNTQDKYTCYDIDTHKPWYQRWKDTALIDPFTFVKYRIRWAKSEYKLGGPYFHVPVDQLREFPGFVYHCHILGHEDDEMMRPIMLQIPDNYEPTNLDSKCRQRDWAEKYLCLNQQCQGSVENQKSQRSQRSQKSHKRHMQLN